MDRANNKHYRVAYSQSTPKLGLISIEQLLKTPIYASHGWQQTEASTRVAEIYQTIFMLYSLLYCNIMQAGLFLIKVIIEKSRGEGSLMEQDTIENVS